jgi:oxygen-dependent protoporphyrinogen oxidase
MPRFLDMERDSGSLIRGTLRDAAARRSAGDSSGARYSLFMTPRRGLASLVEAIANRLPEDTVKLATSVMGVARSENGWQLTLKDANGQTKTEAFDSLILAIQAYRAAALLEPVDAELANELARIEYASSAVISLVYQRSQVDHPLDGFGFVVPAVEKRRILSASFSSVKFPGRATREQVLIRVFIGGACQAQLLDLDDAVLRQIAIEELSQLIGAHGEPVSCEIRRWPRSMPQYHLGHCELIERIEQRTSALPRLALAGNAYHGVGIPHCIHSGEQAAEKIANTFRDT